MSFDTQNQKGILMRFIHSVCIFVSLLLLTILTACSGESPTETEKKSSHSDIATSGDARGTEPGEAPLHAERGAAAAISGSKGVKTDEAAEKTEDENSPEDERNAAELYNKAFELLKFPPNSSAERRMTITMHMGWAKGGGQDFIDSFPQNEACLAEFKKALEKERCDFFLGVPRVQLPSGDSWTNKSIWYLTCLHLVRARYYESLRQWKDAFADGLSVLHFTRHVAQNLPFIYKVTANNCELRALITLTEIVKKNNIDKGSLAFLAGGLEEHETKRHAAWRMMEDEKAYFRFVIERLYQELTDDEGEKVDAGFMKSLKRKSLGLADEYYDLAKTAYESDQAEAWSAVEDEHTSALTATLEVRDTITTVSQLEDYIIDVAKDRGKRAVSEIARFLLGYYTSSAKSMWESDQKNKALLSALQTRVGPA